MNESQLKEVLSGLYREATGKVASVISALPASGSNRRYFRVSGDAGSLIAVQGTCAEENKAFIYLSQHFSSKGLRVPKVLAQTPDALLYIQEDLGGESLFDHLDERELLFRTMRELPKFQFRGAEGLDWSVCYPQKEFDGRMVSFDLNYFKYCFLKLSGLEFDETRLENDFDALRQKLMAYAGTDTFLYRDFQARNVMVRDGEPWFIDFQGGRRGPIYYDVASFVWQARAGYDNDLRAQLIDAYLESLAQFTEVDKPAFLATLRHFVLFRSLQVLGAYGFRGCFERKPHFIKSIPFAMRNLRELLAEPFAEYPYLSETLLRLAEQYPVRNEEPFDGLTVRVISFSFKKGIPADESGNGGGYVFDCRALENPGRLPYYRSFTGRDKEVMDFLEKDGGVFDYLESIYPIADTHVARYISRGFTDLMFCFGCTGGQHRSVYCAEHLARYIAMRYANVRVKLIHREMNLEEIL